MGNCPKVSHLMIDAISVYYPWRDGAKRLLIDQTVSDEQKRPVIILLILWIKYRD
jgi:hypothetical protein